ncbi:MAG: SGNH/GDSL hydrolase family protein [Magnetovibrionaceae bacterium]
MIKGLKIIGINIGLLAVVAVVTELFFGSIFFGTNYGLLVIDRNVSRSFDIKNRYGATAAGALTSRYTRDEHGLRGDYSGPDQIDILTIGGSTTNELLIDDAETWTARLGADLRASGYDLTVANAGVDGQSTFGHLKNFELWFPKIRGLAPKLIIAYVGINDSTYLRAGFEPTKWDRMEEENRTVKQFLINNSALYGLYRTARGMMQAREAMLVHSTPTERDPEWRIADPQPRPDEAAITYADHMVAYRDRVLELIRRIRALGAEAVIVTQATGHYQVRDGLVYGRLLADGRIDTDSYDKLGALNGEAMAACEAAGAICLDLAPQFDFRDGETYDFVHTTPPGSAKVAAILSEALKPHLPRIFGQP